MRQEMRAVIELHRRKYITDRQLLAADIYRRTAQPTHLPPSWHRVLRDFTVEGKLLEEVEAERGWPARSAKQVLGVLLDGLVELGPVDFGAEPANDLSIDKQVIESMRRYRLTLSEASIFKALLDAAPNGLSADRIYLASRAIRGEGVSREGIAVHLSRLRKKLLAERAPWRIACSGGVHHLCLALPSQADIAIYADHVERGLSYREVGSKHGVNPSTVLRIVRRIEEIRDSPEMDAQIQKAVDGILTSPA
jgi:DNA-binding CsgD family transcriptional regulator